MALFDGLFGSAGGVIGDIISGGLTMMGQQDTNRQNAQMASDQMGFQERMSNTAYQRATADMKAAGLNPMLAYAQGGASTPGGAMAQMQNALGAGVQATMNSAATRAQVDQAIAQLDVQRSQAELNRAQALRTNADTGLIVSSNKEVDERVKRLSSENAYGKGMGHYSAMRLAYEATRAMHDAEIRQQENVEGIGKWNAHSNRARARALNASAHLDELDVNRARNVSEAQSGTWGKISGYLPDAARLINGAATLKRLSAF